ncbi:beta-1,3-galactosyltransferase 1 isoform X1 [Hydra vulgaris]|uniref:beta-1,3-galactosyltransferase 1 isoform X1 n=1 Tax=Hydra vulgaris TaxID=6087 RepID=UPI0006412741|nr:beta-1,3-galactosyltransferase 1 [Hydra vulgaris]
MRITELFFYRRTAVILLSVVSIWGVFYLNNKIKDVFLDMNIKNDKHYNYFNKVFNQTNEENDETSSISTKMKEYFQLKPTLVQTTKIPFDYLAKENEALSHIIFDYVEKDNTVTYTLLIIISSHVNNRKRRDRIRESWGSIFNWVTVKKYLLVFVVARTSDAKSMIEIADEARIRRDVLYLDIFEDFYLLTKKVIVGLTWAKNYVKFKALLKGDDDTFVNIDNVIQFINVNDIIDGYFGNKIYKAKVRKFGRYQVSKEEFKKDIYETYCSGGGFILTNSSVYKMTKLFDINKILRIDDAYVGEIAYQAEIPVRGIKGFYMYNNNCKYQKDVMVSHPALIIACNEFLLKKSMIDNGKLPWDLTLEKQSCYDEKVICKIEITK